MGCYFQQGCHPYEVKQVAWKVPAHCVAIALLLRCIGHRLCEVPHAIQMSHHLYIPGRQAEEVIRSPKNTSCWISCQ